MDNPAYLLTCEVCQNRFMFKSDLVEHMRSTHANRRFECVQCDKSFGLKKHLLRHVRSIHNKDVHKCEQCSKTFNRADALKRHQLICKFKCPRCSNSFDSMSHLTEHMKICPVPSCDICSKIFVSQQELKQHEKMHRKRKATPTIPSAPIKKKKIGAFHCNICMDNFERRQELFQHQIHSHTEPDIWINQNIDPDFQDEELNNIIRTHASIISLEHDIGDAVSIFNFPLLLRVESESWTTEISSILERVAEINSCESYKVNFSLGLILINKETDEYRYYAPGSNNSFFNKPKRVDRTSDWRDIDISQETLLQYALNNRENTKWIPLMLTNIVVNVYHLGVPMGAGQLPDYISNHNCIVRLEMSNRNQQKNVYDDGKCAFRALAYHRNVTANLHGYDQLEQKTEDLYKKMESWSTYI